MEDYLPGALEKLTRMVGDSAPVVACFRKENCRAGRSHREKFAVAWALNMP
jgi:hypothetical protein